MPAIQTHFDIPGLVDQVLQQDLGLFIDTNNPAGFKRVVYAYLRKNPSKALSIRTVKNSPNRLMLLKKGVDNAEA